MEYYVFQTEAQAQGCLNYINSTPWFPIVGKVNGQPAPDNQATTSWAEAPVEMLSGEWAVPRIPPARLDYLEVPAEDRAAFIAAFGQDIRELSPEDFPAIEEEV